MAKSGLIVTYYFPPAGGGGVQRWLKLIKYMKDRQWNFTIITSSPEQDLPIDESLLDDIPADTRVFRLKNKKTIISALKSIRLFRCKGYWQCWASAWLHITDSRKSWNKQAYKVILKELSRNQYDVVIISSPPYSLSFLAVQLLSEIDCPVYLDLRDPWTINPYKIYPTPLHRRLDQKREINAIASVDHLISAYRSTLNNYDKRIEKFYNKNTLLLPNGYDEDDFAELGKVEKIGPEGFHLGFSGTIYSHLNTPQPVFAAIKELKQENLDVHFNHVGTSAFNLKTLAAKYDIEDQVHLWGYRSHRESLEILNSMDALCLILDDRIMHADKTIGGKFYEYLRLRIPIFAVVPEEGAAAQLIRITQSGISVSGKNLSKIVQTLKILIRRDFTFAWEGIQKYDRYHQAKALASFLEKTV